MEISEHSKLLVLRIVMNFVTPKEIVALSATHTDLQENAASLFRKAIREFHQSEESQRKQIFRIVEDIFPYSCSIFEYTI